jgi:hypothetical protein
LTHFIVCLPVFVLIFGQVWHAALKLQSVQRGHFGRCLFRIRCREQEQELLREFDWVNGTSPNDDAENGRCDDSEYGHDSKVQHACVVDAECGSTTTLRKIVLLQAATRGYIGRRLFKARCIEATRELLDDDVLS